MKKFFICIIVLYTIFLVIANILMGGIPTYPGDIASICFCIYIPLMLPIGIALVGVQTYSDIAEREKLRSACKLLAVYILFAAVVYWSYFNMYFTEGMRLLFPILIAWILSMAALITISKVCKRRCNRHRKIKS